MTDTTPTPYTAGDQINVAHPVIDHTDRVALAVPGDRVWVIEVRGDQMRVRCPEAHLDGWFNTSDIRFTSAKEGTR